MQNLPASLQNHQGIILHNKHYSHNLQVSTHLTANWKHQMQQPNTNCGQIQPPMPLSQEIWRATDEQEDLLKIKKKNPSTRST